MNTPLSPIERVALLLGVDLTYETIWATDRRIDSQIASAMFTSLSGETLDASNESQLLDYLRRIETERTAQLCPSAVLVEKCDAPLGRLALNLTPEELSQPSKLTIRWECGARSVIVVQAGDWTHSEDGTYSLTTLPKAPSGYHSLRIETAIRSAQLRWILAPSQCYFPAPEQTYTGINCFLPSLRSDRNWGCGDLTDLVDFARNLRGHADFQFIALNPLHAIHNRSPYNTSPYLPLSIFTHNFIYVDIERIPDFQASGLARRLRESPAVQKTLEYLRAGDFVDYERVARLKKLFLLLLYRQYRRGPSHDLATYRERKGAWLDNYCAYRAFDDRLHRLDRSVWHWRQWPAEYQAANSEASKALKKSLAWKIDFYAYVEMRFEQQLERANRDVTELGYPIGLYHDLALATDRAGADLWAYPELFASGVRVGSPPDDFNREGQDWGFPALHPRRHAEAGYCYFIESIRAAAAHGGALRFDHVMRLARLYWIPDGMSAKTGAYVRDHFRALLSILAIESNRGKFAVIGEDLGTVPDYFREALDEFGILGYRLVLFERDGQDFRKAEDYAIQSIASFTTHDLPTFDGWLNGADLRARVKAGAMREDELETAYESRRGDIDHLRIVLNLPAQEESANAFFLALCRFLRATPARMRLINLEELLGEMEQQNLPGTTSEHPNWRRRIGKTLAEMAQDSTFLSRAKCLS